MNRISTEKLRAEADRIVSSIQLPQIPGRTLFVNAKSGEDILPLLQESISACSADGGGHVVVPPGFYRCGGPLRLASSVDLHLEPGAVIKFAPDPELYLPAVATRWGGTELYNYSPLIYGNHLHDVAITGSGVFCGGSEGWLNWHDRQKPAQERSRALEDAHIPMEERIFGKGDYLTPCMVQFRCSTRILLDGNSYTDSPLWMIHPLYSSHLTFRNIHTDSMRMCNDGMDIDSCEDVLIENCHFRNGDDAVVIKSGLNADGRRVNRPTRRVVFRSSTIHDAMHGFAIGSELSGGAEDIYVFDIRMKNIWSQALSLKSAPGRGGVIQRIHLFDIGCSKAGDHIISVVSRYFGQNYGSLTTAYKDIEFLNIHCDYAHNGIFLEGSEDHPLENVVLENVETDVAWYDITGASFTGNLKFKNVYSSGKELSPPRQN